MSLKRRCRFRRWPPACRHRRVNLTGSGFLSRQDLRDNTRLSIEKEIGVIKKGRKGELDAAYEIEFGRKDSKFLAIIHDLRIECDGETAQIDHLLINRFRKVWVCETKNLSGEIIINDQGEFEVIYKSGRYGIPSPIMQNKKHKRILQKALQSNGIKLPSRFGIRFRVSLWDP